MGESISPVGPIDPATNILFLNSLATSFASAAEIFESLYDFFSNLCNLSLARLAPKLFVKNSSLPASPNILCRFLIFCGSVSFHISGASPLLRPISKRLVPIAPSASNQSLCSSASVKLDRIVIPFLQRFNSNKKINKVHKIH